MMDCKNDDLFLNLKKQHPSYIPVVVLPANSSPQTPKLVQHNFLIHQDQTFSHLIFKIRQQFQLEGKKLSSEQGLFFFVGQQDVFPSPTENLFLIFEKYATEKKYLIVKYALENTFG